MAVHLLVVPLNLVKILSYSKRPAARAIANIVMFISRAAFRL